MASLQGQIVEFYTGRSVQGAIVNFGGRTAITDADGWFTIQNVQPGTFNLTVAHRDFQQLSTALSLTQNMAYTLPAPIRIMSVVRSL